MKGREALDKIRITLGFIIKETAHMNEVNEHLEEILRSHGWVHLDDFIPEKSIDIRPTTIRDIIGRDK
jgi:hypothetical protein